MFEILFISALGLSLLMCATPGAVNTEALRRGVAGGFRRAFMLEIGSCIGDLFWASLALVGLAFLTENSTLRIALGIGGSALLLYLAYKGIMDARRCEMPEVPENLGKDDLTTGALISLGNPFQLAFWVGIGGTAIAVIVPDPETIHYMVFFLGYTSGLLVFSILYSSLVAYGRRYITPKLFQIINILCALVLVYFALSLIYATFIE
ncbi:MAG: LysE family transporter [Methanomassiliicoccales archaeon]|nr:MAG: LysE family transporter [Methanomassiliicoccales archaeon]